MLVQYAINKKDKSKFKKFRKQLYKNDPYYVSTIEFTCDMLLYKTTHFSKTCDILPIMILDKDILCEALFIKAPNDDFIQVSFFEALQNQNKAVEMLIEEAKQFASKHNVKKIIIGLNGHLSYGVGLTVDIKSKNTFDSTYSKQYYNNYFKNYNKHELVSFSSEVKDIINSIPYREKDIIIKKANLKNFAIEMENLRKICDQTIGNTYLYSQTHEKHFEDLMKDMLFFLKSENLLFAYAKDELVGFAFWHPDYNEVLKSGKNNSLLSIAINYITKKNKIKKVKLNSIGVKEHYQGIVTMKLLKEVSKYITNYQTLETNFVWCNNKKSMSLNKHILKNIERRFVVYEVNL